MGPNSTRSMPRARHGLRARSCDNAHGQTLGSGPMSLADKFNLLNELNILRLICGLFFIPHIYGKFYEPAALGFFVAAKFKPPKFWMYLAAAVEAVAAIGL